MGENADIYERLNRIEQTLARIDERTKGFPEGIKDQEKRIRVLERDNDRRKGVIAALSFFSSVVGAVLVWVFKNVFGGTQ